MKNNKGFTLIELLAVIIILGILMIIAIPSVTNYISDSRKEAYIDTAKEIVSGTRNKVNDGKLGMYDTSATYYIPADYINTENGLKSPYGEFTQAYVGVTYDGNGYNYYWISVDNAGQGIEDVTALDDLKTDLIKSDLKEDDILDRVKTTGIDGKKNIYVLTNGTWDGPYQAERAPEGSSGGSSDIVYPTGKTKETVVTGDKVTIGTEEFYVVKHDGNNLILLSRYNLNVGSYKVPNATEGIQNSEAKGWLSSGTIYGNLAFSISPNNNYWDSYTSDSDYFVDVYNSDNHMYQYVEYYKNYLENNYDATIKKARLLTYEEAMELGCDPVEHTCKESADPAPVWVYETSYWLSTAYSEMFVWLVYSNATFHYNDYSYPRYCGVRPVIVI